MSSVPPSSDLSPIDRCRWEIGRATLPLYTVSQDQIVQERSGVLFQLADCHFILTCSHDLQENYLDYKLPIYLSPLEENATPIPLGRAVVTQSDPESVDIALIELRSEVVEQLLTRHRFLNISDVDVNAAALRGTYLVAGYPRAMTVRNASDHTVTTTAMGYVTGLFDGELNPNTKYNPQIHIILRYNKDSSVESNGTVSPSPHPIGMSGCGIWRIADSETATVVMPENVRLVAIQHRYNKDRHYIIGSWLRFAMHMIWKHYERLRPVMSGLVLPPHYC